MTDRMTDWKREKLYLELKIGLVFIQKNVSRSYQVSCID